MKTRVVIIFSSLVFFGLSAFHSNRMHAQEKALFSLEDCVAEALANNRSLSAKKEKIEQSILLKRQARSEFLPKLSTSYSYTRFDEEKTFRSTLMGGGQIAVSSVNNYQWKGTVTQPLFTGFALKSSYELAKLGIDQSTFEVALEKLDLTLRTKEAYFDILKADKAVEVAEKAVESLGSHVNVAQSFYKVGMIPINDLLKAEVELGNAKHDLIKAKNASKLARSSLNSVLSRPVDAPINVKDILIYVPEQGTLDRYLEIAFENRAEIKLLDVNIKQADKQIVFAKSGHYPNVVLSYDYIKEGDDPSVSGSEFHDSNSWQVMAALSWTFWEWGKTYYSMEEKRSFRQELFETKIALKDNISLEVQKAVLALQEAEQNIPTTTKAVEQAEENLRVSRERYKAQVTTSTEVLDAQTLLTQARTNYFSALYDHNLARASLKRALGTY
ncbi:MAG: TolC family protein [Desulfatiglans sp.]|nr:TolC family protein [Thermodesulfobacteriota bacterium]MEE4351942.1 TolC family protein [Desulfatiglans sp.]